MSFVVHQMGNQNTENAGYPRMELGVVRDNGKLSEHAGNGESRSQFDFGPQRSGALKT